MIAYLTLELVCPCGYNPSKRKMSLRYNLAEEET